MPNATDMAPGAWRRYVANPNLCPYCGGSLDADGFEPQDNDASRDVACLDCGRSWVDWAVLANATNVTEPPEDHQPPRLITRAPEDEAETVERIRDLLSIADSDGYVTVTVLVPMSLLLGDVTFDHQLDAISERMTGNGGCLEDISVAFAGVRYADQAGPDMVPLEVTAYLEVDALDDTVQEKVGITPP